MFSSAIFVTLLLFREISAIPTTKITSIIPNDAARIAFDEETGHYIAFDKEHKILGHFIPHKQDISHNKRDSDCALLSVEEAQKLPAWNNIVKAFDDAFGTGSHEIKTNNPDFPDSPALVCVQPETIQLSFTGDPTCSTNYDVVNGVLQSDGQVQIQVQNGFTASTELTVMQESTIGVDSTTSVEVGIPEIAEVTQSFTLSTSLTNSNAQGTTASYGSITTNQITYDVAKGQNCTATVAAQTCTLQATGTVNYYASGWIWFVYKKKVQGHWNWAYNMNAIIPNRQDLSSQMHLTGSVKAENHLSYNSTCS
ncbi:hypothetical protein VKT23_020486 [Stygiomarasmius scandens]|uniref:Uncharacterized protein n=1 Tax=Marasmiellus scandens TaxID=2682957 RepID=A0ABR1IIZ7_9AGAR